MANLSITAADVTPALVFEQLPAGPTDEALSAGEAIKINTSTGKYTPANGTDAAEARAIGLALTTATYAGQAITVIKKGIVDVGDALDGLNYDQAVYLSDTDGTLADAAGTVSVVVGRVVPGWGATTADKLLLVDL